MASLTVRNRRGAEEALRLRAAANGRSMEEEVRLFCAERREATAPAEPAQCTARPPRKPRRRRDRTAATHPPHHRRRHRRLQVARPDPAAAGARRRCACVLTSGGAAIRHAAVGRRARGRARLHRPVRPDERVRRRPYPARARHRSDRGRARDRRPDGEDGGRPCRRSRHRGAARDRQAGPARAGDESAHVEQPGDAAQPRPAHAPTASRSSARTPARWPRAAKPASAAWPSR